MPAAAKRPMQAAVDDLDGATHEALYARAASLATAGEHEQALQVRKQASELYSLQLLTEGGADLERLKTDSAYAVAIGRTFYNRWLMGPSCVALRHALDDPARRREAQFVLAQALHYMGRVGESEAVWRDMLDAKPEPALHGYLLYNLFFRNDGYAAHNEEARRWSKMWVDTQPPPRPVFHVERRADRPIRVGYMTPTFSNQVRHFLTPALEHHDRDGFPVTMYVDDGDKEEQIPGVTLKSVRDLTPRATADLIRQDKIDILVDLHGHYRLGRPLTTAQKPAPVIVSWLDYMQTRGLDAVDYVFHGDHMDAPGTAETFVEKIWNLGVTLVPYRPGPQTRPSYVAPCKQNGYVTFASFNHPAKLSDPTVENWARILKACPTAKLKLKYSTFEDPVLRAETTARFVAHGAVTDQLIFEGHSKGPAYEQAFAEIDLALDPSPITGGTTTMDALARSVPVLTLRGDDFYARVGVHALMAIDMPDMVADSWDEYVAKACRLAGDFKAVQALRDKTREALDASPYRDEEGFARRLEAAYRQMFETWLASPAAAATLPDKSAPPPTTTLKDEFALAKMAVLSGHPDDALPRLATLLKSAPADPELHYWRASAHFAAGDIEAGHAALDEARIFHSVVVLRGMKGDVARIRREPAHAAAVGLELYRQKWVAVASMALGNAFSGDKFKESDLLTLGLAFQHQGRVEEAANVFRAAAEHFDSSAAYQFLLYSLFFVKDGVHRYAAEARIWAERFTGAIQPLPGPHSNKRTADRRLKIGFVAPSFTRSQLKQFIMPVVDNHDQAKLELFFYTADPTKEDRLPGMVRGIGRMADKAAAEAIRKDGVDILIDLWGFTAGGRLGVFAYKPAPIQASWMNLIQTTGLPAIDYVFHADAMDAPGTQELFTETVRRIGPVLAPYRPAEGRLPPAPTPALSESFVTFGSFTHPVRLNDETIAAWARILKGRRGSRLLLKYAYYVDPVLRSTIQARFAGHGVEPSRILFKGHDTGAAYFAEFARVDLALDPSPCPGGTTTCDALANGVPVLTMRGPDFYSRMGVPVIPFPELIAEDWDDYVAKAIALTADVDALNEMRGRVRPAFEALPVCDEKGFARTMEAVYRDLVAEWAAKADA